MILITLALIFFSVSTCKSSREIEQSTGINTALKDSMKTWKDKEGKFVAHISLLEGYNSKDFIALASADKKIQELQKLVSKYESQIKKGGNVTIINTDSKIQVTVPSKVTETPIKIGDTIYASYESNFNLKNWVVGNIKASKDSTTIGLQFKEQLDVVIGTEKTGFLGLGKPKAFAEVKLHNPYNEITSFKAYSTRPLPAKKFGIGPTLSYGVGSGFTPEVFIGIGISWNIIKF
jgi:hypothetical protein